MRTTLAKTLIPLFTWVVCLGAGTLKLNNDEVRYSTMTADIAAFARANKLWTEGKYEEMVTILFDLTGKGYRKPIALLGNAYAGGFGAPRSLQTARTNWRRAAMLGNDFSMRTLSNNYEVSSESPSPRESAFWSVVANAFEDPSSHFAIGVDLTSQRLAKLPEHERTLVLMTAKETIERIKVIKAKYDAVIAPEL